MNLHYKMIFSAVSGYHIRQAHYKKNSCKAHISVIYYKRCKKTRMWILLMVPKPHTADGLRGEESIRKKKTKWRKET